MLGNELRGLRELGNRVLGVELLVLDVGDELLSARVVGAEELELAVMERAPQREAHVVRRAALGLQRIVRRPLERLHRTLHRDFRGNHQVLRRAEHRRQDVPLELALGLLARQRLRTLLIGRALREEHRLLRRALAPLLDRVGVTHHLDVRAVLHLGHVRILRADHLLHDRVELVDVRRPEQDARKPALRDAVEVALRRLDLDLLGVVVIRQVRAHDVLNDVLFLRGRESARLALEESGGGGRCRRRMYGRILLRRDLQQDRRGIVEEEVREILQLIGMRIALQLADDGAERLRLRQHLHLDVERLRTILKPRTAVKWLPARGLLVAKRLLRAKGFALAKRLLIPESPLLIPDP